MFNDLFWALYLIDVLSDFPALIFIPLLSGLAILVIIAIHNDDHCASEAWSYKKGVGWTVLVSVLCALFIMAVPSKQTMYMMLGVRVTDNFTQTEMGKKLEVYINSQMDEFLNKGKAK